MRLEANRRHSGAFGSRGRSRPFVGQLAVDRHDLRFRLRESHVRFQPSHRTHLDLVRVTRKCGPVTHHLTDHRHRKPDIARRSHLVPGEAWRRDPDDRVDDSIQGERPADDVRCTSVMTLPIGVAYDRQRDGCHDRWSSSGRNVLPSIAVTPRVVK